MNAKDARFEAEKAALKSVLYNINQAVHAGYMSTDFRYTCDIKAINTCKTALKALGYIIKYKVVVTRKADWLNKELTENQVEINWRKGNEE